MPRAALSGQLVAITISIYVNDPVGQIATGYNEIVLYSDTSPLGSFATQVGTASLVGGSTPTYLYTITDANGTAANVYRYVYYDSVHGATSPYSEIFWPSGTTLASLRIGAAREAAAGYDGTCSAAGSTTTLVDALLLDSGVNSDFGQGLWIYRPNAQLASDMQRRVASGGFNASTGTFTVSRAWTNAPASGEVYQVFAYYPVLDAPGVSMSWNRLVRRALREAWFVQQINLGLGNPPISRFSLSPYLAYTTEPDIRRVIRRYVDSAGVTHDFDSDKMGRYWYTVPNAPGDLSIEICPPPTAQEDIIVEVERVDPNLYQDSDLTLCPYEYAIEAIGWQLYLQLNYEQVGKYAGELSVAQGRFQRLMRKYRPAGVLRGV